MRFLPGLFCKWKAEIICIPTESRKSLDTERKIKCSKGRKAPRLECQLPTALFALFTAGSPAPRTVPGT